jgi:hypothetical protein
LISHREPATGDGDHGSRPADAVPRLQARGRTPRENTSLWLGAFPAAVIAPHAVRVLPNRVWRYGIPVYALGIAVMSLVSL